MSQDDLKFRRELSALEPSLESESITETILSVNL